MLVRSRRLLLVLVLVSGMALALGLAPPVVSAVARDAEGRTGGDTAAGVAAEAAAGDVFVVDAVDSARDNQWVAEQTGTSTVTIEVGDTVEWQFDRAVMGHDVTSRDTASRWSPVLQEYRDAGGAPVRYTFTRPGTYEYWCSIHGATMRGTVVVEEPAPVNRPPTASPFVSPRTGAGPLFVHFEAYASDPDGDPLTYLWDFGQGDGPSDRSTSSHAHVTYAEPGSYIATLTVSDGRGGTYEQGFPITVTGEVPRVRATGTPTSGRAPLLVSFAGTAEDDQGGAISYRWDFGDGTTSAAGPKPLAQHTYTEPGTYRAVLTATDLDGNSGSATVRIDVEALPAVEATATPGTAAAPLTVQLSTEVTTGGDVRAFADGTATYPDIAGTASMVRSRGTTVTTLDVTRLRPDAPHMVHVHEQSCADGSGGPHFRFDTNLPFSEQNEIWLPFTSDADGDSGEVVVTSDQRAGSKAVAIVIHDPLDASRRIGCVDLDPSTDALTYAWDLGDGTTALGADPTHTYPAPGTYTATVTVGSEDGTDEVTDSVQVVVGADQPPTEPIPSTLTASGPVDATPPDTTLTRGPTGAARGPAATFAFASSEPGSSTFQCSLDEAAWAPCSSPATFTRLAQGEHELRVRAIDGSGNVDASPATRTWTVDRGRPRVTVLPGPDATPDRTPTVRARISDRLDRLQGRNVRVTFAGRVARDVRLTSSGVLVATARPLAPGRHRVVITVRDEAGNTSVTRSWIRVLR